MASPSWFPPDTFLEGAAAWRGAAGHHGGRRNVHTGCILKVEAAGRCWWMGCGVWVRGCQRWPQALV